MAFPTLVGEVLLSPETGARVFPFRSWAAENGFAYPESAEPFFCQCGSAAEAYFARPFIAAFMGELQYPKVNVAASHGISFELQARCAGYWIDALICNGRFSLAVEIDGHAFHHRTQEQVANDYLRQRRIVLVGHTVVRFTAQEVFSDANECWRQVFEILASRRKA